LRCASAPRTARVEGQPPRSGQLQHRVPRNVRSASLKHRRIQDNNRDRADRRRPRHQQCRVSHGARHRPLTANRVSGNGFGAEGTTPTVGRAHDVAGIFSEPPRSGPSAIGNRPAASAAPGAVEPPAPYWVVWIDGRAGQRVVGVRPHAEPGTFVFQSTAPALRSRSTSSES
jgi:hypothetical protein